MEEQKKITVLCMMKYALLMTIFLALLITGDLARKVERKAKAEKPVVTSEEAKKIKRIQLFQKENQPIEIEGEDMQIVIPEE